jgi:carboxylesterase
MSAKDFSFQVDGTSGKGVLLVHGLTGAPGEMKFLANRLTKRGFSIRAPQLAGHGVDEATLLKTRWPHWLDSVRTALDRLSPEVDEVYVAGICVGGALGLALAAEDQRIRGCAVYSMTYRYDGWNMKRWYSGVVPLVRPFANLPGFRQLSFAEPHPFGLKDERLRERVNDAAKPMIPGALPRLPLGCMYEMHALADHIDRVGKTITQPTLILHARDDDMSDPRNAERLRRALGGPVDLRLLGDSYHMIHVDRERDLVADLTASFFGAPASTPRMTGQLANA